MFGLLLSTILVGAIGTQGAAIAKRNSTSPSLFTRQGPGDTLWEDDRGDTAVKFGNDKISFGTLNPTDAIGSLFERCYDQGLCSADAWEIPFTSGESDFTMTVEALEGQYKGDLKEPLIQGMIAAAGTEGIIETSTEQACSGGGCVGCAWTCYDYTRYVFPSSIGISRGYKDDTPDVISIRFTNDIEGQGSDFCKKLVGAAGAIAGGVNGAVGGAFSLGALFCE